MKISVCLDSKYKMYPIRGATVLIVVGIVRLVTAINLAPNERVKELVHFVLKIQHVDGIGILVARHTIPVVDAAPSPQSTALPSPPSNLVPLLREHLMNPLEPLLILVVGSSLKILFGHLNPERNTMT